MILILKVNLTKSGYLTNNTNDLILCEDNVMFSMFSFIVMFD